jgi:hypothetical protein
MPITPQGPTSSSSSDDEREWCNGYTTPATSVSHQSSDGSGDDASIASIRPHQHTAAQLRVPGAISLMSSRDDSYISYLTAAQSNAIFTALIDQDGLIPEQARHKIERVLEYTGSIEPPWHQNLVGNIMNYATRQTGRLAATGRTEEGTTVIGGTSRRRPRDSLLRSQATNDKDALQMLYSNLGVPWDPRKTIGDLALDLVTQLHLRSEAEKLQKSEPEIGYDVCTYDTEQPWRTWVGAAGGVTATALAAYALTHGTRMLQKSLSGYWEPKE